MLRYIGALALVLSSWAVGAVVAAYEKETLKTLDALYDMNEYLRRRIKSGRVPLGIIFSQYRNERLEKQGFLPIMRQSGDISVLWESAAEQLPIGGEAKEACLAFGAELGKLGYDDQEKRLDEFSAFLMSEREKTGAGLKDRQRSVRVCALLIGLLAAILLI